MDEARVRALTREIMALPEEERQGLARELLPVFLTTRAGLEEIDEALGALSDAELDAIVERARSRSRDLPDSTVAAVIGEAIRAVRAQGRS